MIRILSGIQSQLLVVILTDCDSGNTLPDEPDWINNPGDGAVSSAVTHVKGRYYQEDLAITRARERLAARYGVKISSVHTVMKQVTNDLAYITSTKQIDQRALTTPPLKRRCAKPGTTERMTWCGCGCIRSSSQDKTRVAIRHTHS